MVRLWSFRWALATPKCESFLITDNELAEITMTDKDCTEKLTYMI